MSFTAQVPTYFMGIMGYKNIAVSGTSTASYTLPTYINFYLMLDVSGSMSFPSTAAEQERLQAVNPDNYTLYPKAARSPAISPRRAHARSQSEQRYPAFQPSKYTSTYNPSPGRLLPGLYHLAAGHHADGLHFAHQLLEHRPQRYQLDQYAGQFLPDRRNHLLHPIARRRRRLCGDAVAVASIHHGDQ